jgi:hypothetical protein
MPTPIEFLRTTGKIRMVELYSGIDLRHPRVAARSDLVKDQLK